MTRLEQLENELHSSSTPDLLTDKEHSFLAHEIEMINYITPLKAISMPRANLYRKRWGRKTWKKYLGKYNKSKFWKNLEDSQKDYLLNGDLNKQII